MYILPLLLFAVSANIDSLALGAAYGVKKKVVPLSGNLVIAFIAFAGTLFSMLLGRNVNKFMPVYAANCLGGLIIVSIGIISILNCFKTRRNHEIAGMEGSSFQNDDDSKKIGFYEAIALGCALSINNIGLGIGAGISGLPTLPAAFSSLLLSFIFISVGNALGIAFFSKCPASFTELATGTIIVTLGICQIALP